MVVTAAALTACSSAASLSTNAPTCPSRPAPRQRRRPPAPRRQRNPRRMSGRCRTCCLPTSGASRRTPSRSARRCSRDWQWRSESRRALEAAYASDHGPAFVQMFAPGRRPRPTGAARCPTAGGLPHCLRRLRHGRARTARRPPGDGHQRPSTAGTIGSFYAFVDGGTLIVARPWPSRSRRRPSRSCRRRIEPVPLCGRRWQRLRTGEWQDDREGGPLAEPAPDRDPAAHQLHQPA